MKKRAGGPLTGRGSRPLGLLLLLANAREQEGAGEINGLLSPTLTPYMLVVQWNTDIYHKVGMEVQVAEYVRSAQSFYSPIQSKPTFPYLN